MEVLFVMFKDNGDRKDFSVRNQSTIVGRQEDCDIRIPLPEVSRQHAEITITRQGVLVKDLGSSNGTYVNNRRVKQKQLEPGDHLVIGPVVFTVQIDGSPLEIRPVKTKLRRQSVFSPEDDLAAGLGKDVADDLSGSKTRSADSEILEALEASSDSGLNIEIDELDLGDSAIAGDKP